MNQPASGATRAKAHDRAWTERSLIGVAAEVFAAKGYENSTTREIAAKAACAEALIHRYFGNKNGLLIAVVRDGLVRLPSVDIENLPQVGTLAEEIAQLAEATAKNLQTRAQHICITFSRALIDPEFVDFKNIVLRPERLAVVEKRLAYCKAGKMIHPDIDIPAATEMLLGGIFQLAFVHRFVMKIDPDEYNSKMRGFCEIFCRGVQA